MGYPRQAKPASGIPFFDRVGRPKTIEPFAMSGRAGGDFSRLTPQRHCRSTVSVLAYTSGHLAPPFMQPRADNPPLPSWLRQATFAASLGLLAAGGALFFLPAL